MTINLILKSKKQRINKSKVKRLIFFLQQSLSFNKTSISIVFCGERFIKKLNKEYRGIDKSTDVLSFESDEEKYLGDIIISIPNIEKNCKRYNVFFEEELLRVIIHGVLHLIGYEHKDNNSPMIRLQEELLEKFKNIEND